MTRSISVLVLALALGSARADEASTADDTAVTISLPAEQSPGCLADSMRFPRELAARLPERAVLEFTVEQTGAVRDVLVDGHASGALATQARGGLSRCAWTPAADASGRPMTVSVLLPVRFERAATAVAVRAPSAAGRLALAAR